MQKAIIREPADMSWARAIVLATGVFLISAIYLGQIPSFFELIANQATLARMDQSLLELGILALGLALAGLTATFLFDPKPVSKIFIVLFGGLGSAFVAGGAVLMALVFNGTLHEFLPDQTVQPVPGQAPIITNWPNPNIPYLFHPALFQPQSIDLGATGFILLAVGGGILGYVGLYFPFSQGKLTGAVRTMIVQLCAGSAGALVLAYLTLYTFSANATTRYNAHGWFENVLLAIALFLVLFALQTWLLPVMTAPMNRQRFMPANYLHAVMLIGNVAGPLLTLFVLLYPIVNFLARNLPTDNWFVQCASASSIPASCTFTPNVGYVVAGIVSGMFFTFMIAAGYLWSRKPAFTRMGMVYAFVFAALAVVGTHTTDPKMTPIALSIGIGVGLTGLVWTISTQKEFVPVAVEAQALGCTGQWLVLGTLFLIYMAGFGLFSYPNFFDTEQNLIVLQGRFGIHDAYWTLIIASLLAAIQFAFLSRRQPIGTLRKAALWGVLIGSAMEVAASIKFDLKNGSPMNILYFAGIAFVLLGVLAGLYGAFQTRERGGIGFILLSAVSVFIGVALAFFCYTLNRVELTVFFTCLMGAGAVVFSIYGSDAPDQFLTRLAGSRRATA